MFSTEKAITTNPSVHVHSLTHKQRNPYLAVAYIRGWLVGLRAAGHADAVSERVSVSRTPSRIAELSSLVAPQSGACRSCHHPAVL